MVTKTDILTRVDRNLGSVSDMLSDLPIVAEEWDDETIINRIIWATEWHETMDRLETVRRAYEKRLLTAHQEQLYRSVLIELERQLPTVCRLDLHPPHHLLP